MMHIWPTAHHVLSAELFSGSQSLAYPWQQGVSVPQAQDFAAVIVGFHKDLVIPVLNCSHVLKHISFMPGLKLIYKLDEDTLHLVLQVIDKDGKHVK